MNIQDLRPKAESGNIAARSIPGVCYLDGIDTPVNYAEALRFLPAASAKGSPRAMANPAGMHADGLGIPRDVAEAVRLYRASAEQGEFFA
jgi:uncharacterized protein